MTPPLPEESSFSLPSAEVGDGQALTASDKETMTGERFPRRVNPAVPSLDMMDDQLSLADSATLEHLIVVPRGGLGNALRAVAAARRLCSLTGAKLTVVWEFGNYEALIAPDPGTEVFDRLPSHVASLRHIRLRRMSEGGNNGNRRVPIREDRALIVESWFWFCAVEEPLVSEREALTDWLPRPAEVIQDRVREFAEANFRRTVGMHIRQGDNDRKLVVTPIEAFLREAERVVAEDRSIFLATDSEETEKMMRARFGERIIVFPKKWDLPYRWPRLNANGEKLSPHLLEKQFAVDAAESSPDFVDTELLAAGSELVPDFVDMQLLAACDYVIGSKMSSYSQMAARYNGSAHCVLLPAPPPHPVWGKALEPPGKMRNRVAMMVKPGSDRNGRPRIRRNDYAALAVPELGQWTPKLTVSVVIPAYGNQEKLDLTLAGLAAQSYPSHLMQVVVVDDGSSTPLRLPEVVPEHTRIISSAPDGWGAGHAMRAGVEAADGDVIHRLDSDMLVYREHIEANMRWHHLTDYLVVIGYKRFVDFVPGRHSLGNVRDAIASGEADTLFDLENSHPSWIEKVIDETDGLRTAGWRAYQIGTGQTISLTRRLYEECGGVDSALVRGQDTEFSYRAAQAGAVFVPEPEARAFHLGLTEMMTRHTEGMRFREPYLSNRVPLRRTWREAAGRQWLVPYVDVIVDVSGASYEKGRATVAGALASSLVDVRVTLVGPWSEATGDRRSPLDDPLLDLRLIREAFMHDGRVRLAESVPPTSEPVPFRFDCPAGWVLTADALHKLINLANNKCYGMISLALPEGSESGKPGRRIGRFERTAAVARALRLRQEGEGLEEVVDEIFGVHRIDGTAWALTRAVDKPKRGAVPPLREERTRAYKAEATRWRKESVRWEKEVARLRRELQEPLGKKLFKAARKRLVRR
ncbi:glycosyltransferase [Streptosporangium sp. NPDC000396]|uniref:glycosyltransferase n=1 Tax=Streptosporangium sp. NPDC000396 TaxID=3366185 RepID=UPI0036A99A2B